MSFRRCHSNWKPKNLKQVHLWRYLGHEYQRFLGMLHRTPLCGQMSLRDSCRFLQCQLCPDITGTANYLSVGLTFDAKPHPTGAFYCPNVSANGGVAGDSLWRMDSFQFAARWSSSTYGNSSGVSVSACYALIIIKT